MGAEPDFTIAFESTSVNTVFGGRAGFFCVWENEITFVASAWVRWAMAYVSVLPARFRPSGPDDPRTRTRIPFADLTALASNTAGRQGASKTMYKLVQGDKLVVATRDGTVRYYTGGQLNQGFGFENVAPLVEQLLAAAGYRTERSDGTLEVHRDGS